MKLSSALLTLSIPLVTYLAFGRKYFAGGVCHIKKDLTGKVVVITGANAGIGKETARQLAKMGATVVLACRSAEKTLPVVEELKKSTSNRNIEFIKLDLSDLKSIKEFAETFKTKYQRLDILINNAAVLSLTRQTSQDGFELMFATNHLGHFYLTNLLLDVIKESGPSRIVNVSAQGHHMAKMDWDDLMFEKNKYTFWHSSGNTKLANVLFAKELQRRLEGSDVKVVSLHPGAIKTEAANVFKTNFFYNMMFNWVFISSIRVFGKTLEQGVQTTLYCALEDQDKIVGGGYYSDCKIAKESDAARSEDNQKRLWDISEKLISEKMSN